MMKKLLAAVMMTCTALSAQAWPMYDAFKKVGVEGNAQSLRVVDFSDSRRNTTSEGQSYGMFFALVANDPEAFEAMGRWTEDNLSRGDITKLLPMWLWGAKGEGAARTWGVIDTNNAVDSDVWIAYNYLEAGRLWNKPEYVERARAMMELLKKEVRVVDNLGAVLLPGRVGFERDGNVKLNPSYYPLFILKRFAQEDAYWNAVYEGSLRALLRSAPSGIAPDWAVFDKNGRFVQPFDEDTRIGSYNAIRTYMWAGMMSEADPSRALLVRQFAPMVRATRELNMPPEKVNVMDLSVNQAGSDGFGACLLSLLDNDKTAAFIRTVLAARPMLGENYYSNVLVLYGAGFDEKRFAFDRDGRLVFPNNPDWPAATAAAAQ